MLGGGFRVVALGDRQYVASVPKELDRDSNTVMQAAQVGEKREKNLNVMHVNML